MKIFILKKGLSLFIFALLSTIPQAISQTPCFSIHNNSACNAKVTWETVDGGNAHIAGASYVTLSAYGTLNITGSACNNAVDIYVRLEELGGISTGQSQPINGVIQTSYSNESGNNGNTCNSGVWNIDWATGNPVQIW